MALIKCPNCGSDISDKASACPHCSVALNQFIKCEDCGTLFSNELKDCPKCGCPVSCSVVEETHTNQNKPATKKKNLMVIGIVVVLVLIIGIVGVSLSSNHDSRNMSVPKNKAIVCESLSDYQSNLIDTIIRESVDWYNRTNPNDIVALNEIPPKKVSDSLSLLKASISTTTQSEEALPAQYIVAEMASTALSSPLDSSTRAIRISAESLASIKERIETAISYYY